MKHYQSNKPNPLSISSLNIQNPNKKRIFLSQCSNSFYMLLLSCFKWQINTSFPSAVQQCGYFHSQREDRHLLKLCFRHENTKTERRPSVGGRHRVEAVPPRRGRHLSPGWHSSQAIKLMFCAALLSIKLFSTAPLVVMWGEHMATLVSRRRTDRLSSSQLVDMKNKQLHKYCALVQSASHKHTNTATRKLPCKLLPKAPGAMWGWESFPCGWDHPVISKPPLPLIYYC